MRDFLLTLWVSNSLSGRGWELHKVPAVANPTHAVQLGGSDRASTGERQRRVAVQRRVRACGVVVALELGQLPFEVTAIPERHVVEKFSPHRPDHAFHEGVGHRHAARS